MSILPIGIISAETAGPPANNTVLLIHSDTIGGSQIFVDSSPVGRVITAVGAVVHSTDRAKFGATSINTSIGNYISMADSDDFPNGSGNWTIDFWVARNGGLGSRKVLCGQADTSAGLDSLGIWLEFNTSNSISALIGNGGGISTLVGTTAVTDALFHHVALTVDFPNIYLYLDGVFQGSISLSNPIRNAGTIFTFGRAGLFASNTFQFPGYFDEIRIVKGQAIWTGTGGFTPPASPYDS